MFRLDRVVISTACALQLSLVVIAEEFPQGTVVEHSGDAGELIVSRDGVVYWLSTGDELFYKDVLRAQRADVSTVSYNGCVFTLEAKVETVLDDETCAVMVPSDATSMAEAAAQNGRSAGVFDGTLNASSPLTVGGIILSAGGLAAVTDGGNGGTESAVSAAAAATAANVDP